jgi:hypothetical protein
LWITHAVRNGAFLSTIPFLCAAEVPECPKGLDRISGWIETNPPSGRKKGWTNKMNETRVYEDGYHAVFREQGEFLECLKNIGRNSFWDRRKSKSLRLVAITEDSQMAKDLKEQYARDGLDEGIITDTITNTGLLLKTRNQYYPVRACAIKSILDRAGINGSGLRRVGKNVYARILNDCLKATKGDALLRISEGKVSAVLGGDSHDYAVLDMEQIFMHSVDYLTANFKGCRYLGGFYGHDMASALWELSGEDGLLEAYREELALHGKTVDEMKPMVRITTSDIGAGGANIFPMLVSGEGNTTISLGDPLRLDHRNGSSISEFDGQLEMLYGRYQLAMGNLSRLLDIEIQNPANCMKGVMDRLGIARRYAAEALELFKAQHGEDPCTAHDIYYGLSEIPYMLTCDGMEGGRIARMEETIARALSLDWREYDIPGGYRW